MSLYPIEWAEGVVNRALEAHARVSEDFLNFTGLSRRQLARVLAEGRPEWPILRDMLKVLDNWCSRSRYNYTPVYYFTNLIKMYRLRLPEGLRIYLDKREFCTRIEEQGNSGEPSSFCSGAPQPLGGARGKSEAV